MSGKKLLTGCWWMGDPQGSVQGTGVRNVKKGAKKWQEGGSNGDKWDGSGENGNI